MYVYCNYCSSEYPNTVIKDRIPRSVRPFGKLSWMTLNASSGSACASTTALRKASAAERLAREAEFSKYELVKKQNTLYMYCMCCSVGYKQVRTTYIKQVRSVHCTVRVSTVLILYFLLSRYFKYDQSTVM